MLFISIFDTSYANISTANGTTESCCKHCITQHICMDLACMFLLILDCAFHLLMYLCPAVAAHVLSAAG